VLFSRSHEAIADLVRASFIASDRPTVSTFMPGATNFKGFEELKEKLSRARPKDSILD
jgi:hypothetical protein